MVNLYEWIESISHMVFVRRLVDDSKPVRPSHTVITQLQSVLDELPKPVYCTRSALGELTETDTKKAVLWLRLRSVELPLIRVPHATVLLRSSGPFTATLPNGTTKELTFPSCVRGNACMGRTVCVGKSEDGCDGVYGMPVGGFVLRMMMFPDEYARFLQTATPPTESRACLLCSRYLCEKICVSLRRYVMLRMDPAECITTFREPVNEIGGYFRIHAMYPTRDRYMGFFDPIIKLRTHLLTASRLSSGVWQIHQDAMVFRNATRPRPSYIDVRMDHF